MIYFLDTEFMESPGTIELLSIAVLRHSETPELYYAVSADAEWSHANLWVQAHVLPHLSQTEQKSRAQIVQDIRRFIGEDTPEFWGYYADYDWVVFCWLFGAMIDLPTGWPMYCRDLQQWCDRLGNPPLPRQTHEHHAGHDVIWNRDVYCLLQNLEQVGTPLT